MSNEVLKEQDGNALRLVETTRKEGFAFGHGSLDAPIVVSNASSIASPITCPHLKEKWPFLNQPRRLLQILRLSSRWKMMSAA